MILGARRPFRDRLTSANRALEQAGLERTLGWAIVIWTAMEVMRFATAFLAGALDILRPLTAWLPW